MAKKKAAIDEVWSDITAPFAKVGAILWKDVKTIQKEMPEFEWSQMVSLMLPDSSWKPGCLNDEGKEVIINGPFLKKFEESQTVETQDCGLHSPENARGS